ncbi:hypothetical protein RBWH47_03767 [Rhodopirellula baltica WH47]|uniref:Uncharacterized protein n=1 Tax=Rhodopirellula baltica WH47 TaxID=991778 RepID=F2ANI9_RHOBT|nr:hypothetical protein RBWH47_03767 [Rhodopirellula baltica WH47]
MSWRYRSTGGHESGSRLDESSAGRMCPFVCGSVGLVRHFEGCSK